MTGLFVFLNFLAWASVVVILPILIGVGLCRALKVKEFSARLAAILVTIFVGFLPFALKVVQTEVFGYQSGGKWVTASEVKEDPATKALSLVDSKADQLVVRKNLAVNEYKQLGDKLVLAKDSEIEIVKRTTFDLSRTTDAISYGIDLAGGTNLVYELDVDNAGGETINTDLMERMVAAVARRINPAGTKEIVVRRVGKTRIEVILPGADPAVVEETKKLMTELGTLEFSIVCNRIDHREIIDLGLKTSDTDVFREGKIVAKWRPVQQKLDEKGNLVQTREFDNQTHAVRQRKDREGKVRDEVLVLYEADERKQVTGKDLKRTYPTRDKNSMPAVGFTFKQAGGYRFGKLTANWQPKQDGRKRQLAVLLNNEIVTAPSLNAVITDQGVIESGRFTDKEVNELVMILNAGALPVPIKKTPISEYTISPTLGYDVQSKGKQALIVASLAVVVFMAGYYFVAGMVADLALLLNLLFIVSVMAFVKAAFTLPGLAGLVLSAGMAVDANVLIYERMREELARGASLRMAIHNGFDKAFVAIFDSNVSTLITAVILYMVGTETVKGFAVALFIGLVMNLYTAVYISRLVMNILERSRTIKHVKMMGLIPVLKYDFVGKQMIASIASCVVIAVGMFAFFMRGNEKYDIDFTGGGSVTMQFNEKQVTDEVRIALEKTFNKNITVEELTPFGSESKGKHFRLRVANEGVTDIKKEDMEDKINKTFPGLLTKTQLSTIGEFEAIPKPEKDKKDESEDHPFAGGHKSALTFSNEIAPATFGRYVYEKLEAIKKVDPITKNSVPKYPKADSLISLEGTAGKGLSVAEGKVKIYNAMTLLASPTVDPDDLQAALTDVQAKMETIPLFDEVTTFESSVAGETKQSALIAIVVSLIALIIYIWFRFENFVFGLAAIVALAHDVLVTLGCVALSGWLWDTPIGRILDLNDFKINMAMIAAFLTIVGYSLNDTIVIFDRLREIRGKNPTVTKDMINLTVNQCLSRTILTALTVFITVVILYVLGGEGIHGFAYCMVIGSIAGTYSTVYIASPLVLVFMKRFAPQQAGGKGPAGPAGAKVRAPSAA